MLNSREHEDATASPAPIGSNDERSRGEAPVRRRGSYDSWTVPELRKRAKELGMTGYSSLSKSDLIYELRKL